MIFSKVVLRGITDPLSSFDNYFLYINLKFPQILAMMIFENRINIICQKVGKEISLFYKP